jgi:hypothetical protein
MKSEVRMGGMKVSGQSTVDKDVRRLAQNPPASDFG